MSMTPTARRAKLSYAASHVRAAEAVYREIGLIAEADELREIADRWDIGDVRVVLEEPARDVSIPPEFSEPTFTGKLSGQTVDHLRHDTSWGREQGGPVENATALAKIMDAPFQKRGFGKQITVSLTRPEAEALIQHLDLAAGAAESMTHEERSGDTAYRAMRKDCEKWDQIINGGDR